MRAANAWERDGQRRIIPRRAEKQGGVATRTQDTYNAASEQKKRSQRIDRQGDHSAEGGYEAPSEPYYGGDHA